MEENRRFSLTDLFIKIILVVIFVLFTVWLLSLSTKGLSNSLDVLTNNIFAENMNKMKEVGKEYFTLERLPEKVGDIKTLTLKKMYDKKLILKLNDKNGNACSAENSYVSVEKYENEYQMKVYLECGEESDYIIVIMGCYDYCKTDICEFDKEQVKDIEYEYKLVTGGKWSDWGKWSEWSKVSVTEQNYRQVETKEVEEEYSYDKTVTEIKYANLEASCPSGYKKTSDGTKCYKTVTKEVYENPVCPTLGSGWSDPSRSGFTCTYTKTIVKETVAPTCPTISGWAFTGRNGFTCNYSQTAVKDTDTPSCPTISGWAFTGRNGFTCSYSQTAVKDTDTPSCPEKSGWTFTGRNGFTCNYSQTVKSSSYTEQYITTKKGSYVPANTDTYVYREIGYPELEFKCDDSCSTVWIHTYEVYKKVYGTTTNTSTENATCPSNYKKENGQCVLYGTNTKTDTATCPSNYKKENGQCVLYGTNTKTDTATCPSNNYKKENGQCLLYGTTSTTENATCPSGYTQSSNTCVKQDVSYKYEDLIKTCPIDYNKTEDGTKCYREVTTTETVTETRKVTYYRYRLREYIGGKPDYKWSKSKEDKKLLDAGYKLTGRTR